MIKKYTEEFKREAVQLALSNNLPRQAIAEDLGLLVTVIIKRSPDPKHPYGIAIDQWIVAAVR